MPKQAAASGSATRTHKTSRSACPIITTPTVLTTTQYAAPDVELKINTDSQYLIDAITVNLQRNEDNDYVGTANKELLRATVGWMRMRSEKTYLIKVKGHSGDEGNDGADAAASEGAEKNFTTMLNLQVPEIFNTLGMRLSVATQSNIYKKIVKLARVKDRQYMDAMLERVKDYIEDWRTRRPRDERI